MKQLYIAKRMGDRDGIEDVEEEISKFNKKRRERGEQGAMIDTESLERSMKSHMRSTEDIVDGVTISPILKKSIMESRSEYDQGFAFF